MESLDRHQDAGAGVADPPLAIHLGHLEVVGEVGFVDRGEDLLGVEASNQRSPQHRRAIGSDHSGLPGGIEDSDAALGPPIARRFGCQELSGHQIAITGRLGRGEETLQDGLRAGPRDRRLGGDVDTSGTAIRYRSHADLLDRPTGRETGAASQYQHQQGHEPPPPGPLPPGLLPGPPLPGPRHRPPDHSSP